MGLESLILDVLESGMKANFISGVMLVGILVSLICMLIAWFITEDIIIRLPIMVLVFVLIYACSMLITVTLAKPVISIVIDNSISITYKNVEHDIEPLPNEVINFKTDTVLVDGKRQNLYMLKNTEFVDIDGQPRLEGRKYEIKIDTMYNNSPLTNWLITEDVLSDCQNVLDYIECIKLYY